MRRKLSIGSLLLAWLFANGAVWNVVQVVAWVKMYHDYVLVMPTAQALQLTFDGSKPCAICVITQKAQDATRDQLPREAAPGGGDKLVLTCELPVAVILSVPASAWPGVSDDAGSARTEAVPVRPPRV